MSITRLTTTAALGAVLWAASPAQAQTFHMLATPEKGVWMEASYADLEIMETSFPSSTWFLSGRMPITDRVRAMVDVPFAHAKVDLGLGKESNTVLGNPYLGLEFLTRSLVLETGVRLPLTTADGESFADVVALLGDIQRSEAFMEDIVPVTAAATYTHGLDRGLSLQARTGVVGVFYTGDNEELDSDALIDYGLLATYPTGAARFGLGFYGRWAATADEGSFGNNSIHHAALSADYKVRGVRPGISIRVPVDSQYEEIVNSTIGLYLQVPIR